MSRKATGGRAGPPPSHPTGRGARGGSPRARLVGDEVAGRDRPAARSLGPSATTASAAMFASASSASGRSSSRRSACPTSTRRRCRPRSARSPRPPADRSRSPHRREAELRRRDREDAGPAADVEHAPRSSFSSSCRQSCVVGWPPVPKARPGRSRPRSRPRRGLQGGPIQSRPTRTGLWNWRQRSHQSSSTSEAAAPPNACQIAPRRRRSWHAASSSAPPSPPSSSKPSGTARASPRGPPPHGRRGR